MVSVPPFARTGLLPLWETGRSVSVMTACSASTGNILTMTITKWSVCMGNANSGRTSNVLAKCGLATLSKCKTRKANLKECEGCKLVTRLTDRWKMIGRKPHKKCRCCGVFLPLDKFYPKRIKKPDGRIYEATEGTCKKCRSREYMKKKYGNYE